MRHTCLFYLFLLAMCQFSQQIDVENFVSTITNNSGWKSLENVKIVIDKDLCSNIDLLNPGEKTNLKAKYICSVIMCQYSHEILIYVSLINRIAYRTKCLLEANEENNFIHELYLKVIGARKDFKYIRDATKFLKHFDTISASLLWSLLDNLYLDSYNTNTTSIYDDLVDKFKKKENIQGYVDRMLEPLNSLNQEINDKIIGRFCTEPTIPSDHQFYIEFGSKENLVQNSLDKFLHTKITVHSYIGRLFYFVLLGFEVNDGLVSLKSIS